MMTLVSSISLKPSLTDDARVVIYDCHVFIVQATGLLPALANLKTYCYNISFTWVSKAYIRVLT
jgi:hypothetical protein